MSRQQQQQQQQQHPRHSAPALLISPPFPSHALPCPRLASPPPTNPSFVIKKAEKRYNELAGMGIAVRLICVGRKGSVYFKRRPQYTVEGA